MSKQSTKKQAAIRANAKRTKKTKKSLITVNNNNFTIEHHIGNVIREQRNTNHLTINEVAELAGISSGMLSRIERGDVSASLDTLEKLAAALGMPMSLFFRDYDVPEGSAQLVD